MTSEYKDRIWKFIITAGRILFVVAMLASIVCLAADMHADKKCTEACVDAGYDSGEGFFMGCISSGGSSFSGSAVKGSSLIYGVPHDPRPPHEERAGGGFARAHAGRMDGGI